MVNYINFALVKLIPVTTKALPDTRTDDAASALRLCAADVVKAVPCKMPFTSLYTKSTAEGHLKLQVFAMAIELIDTSSEIWKSVIALPEIFSPTHAILTSISKKNLFSSLPEPTKVFSPLPF